MEMKKIRLQDRTLVKTDLGGIDGLLYRSPDLIDNGTLISIDGGNNILLEFLFRG